MIDQKIKEICIKALSRVPVPENKQERLKLAFEFADKLYISNYLSSENRQDFIKKELCSYFNLSDEEVTSIITKLESKEFRIKDKLQISKLKRNLKGIEIIPEDEWTNGLNLLEVKKIVQYIKDNYTFSNPELFRKFVLDDLCYYFELTAEEKEKVLEVI